jgi:hypothetical protein
MFSRMIRRGTSRVECHMSIYVSLRHLLIIQVVGPRERRYSAGNTCECKTSYTLRLVLLRMALQFSIFWRSRFPTCTLRWIIDVPVREPSQGPVFLAAFFVSCVVLCLVSCVIVVPYRYRVGVEKRRRKTTREML